MKHGFELHGFFLEPKSAYLEALLYYDFNIKNFEEYIHSILPAHIYIRDHPYITSALFGTLSAQENFKCIYSFITVE